MDKFVIKELLLDYNRQFKKMMGSFDSFKIVYDYLNFVTSDLYLAKLLLPLVENYENDANALEELNMDSFSIDLTKPGGLAQMPIFKEQYQYWQKQIDNEENIDLRKGLPIYFASLSIAAYMIEEIKILNMAGDIAGAQKLIEEVKDKSMAIADSKMVNGLETKKRTIGQCLDISMEQINKYLIDEIDSQMLLNDSRPQKPLFYDESTNILSIHGNKIHIRLKSSEPLDHYILLALSESDFKEKVFYSEITHDYFEGEENKSRGLYSACERLNEKIANQTNNTILKFIDYTSGKAGWCKTNQKYL